MARWPNDFAAQAKQTFANLEVALAAAGAKPANLIKINYFVVGLNHEKLVALREARDSVIDNDHPPASTLAGVQALFRDDVQIEIEAEAVIPWSSAGVTDGKNQMTIPALTGLQDLGSRLILCVGRVLLQDELLDQCIGNSSAGVDERAR
jgi:hypothetical protein